MSIFISDNVESVSETLIRGLGHKATQLRIHSVQATSNAGSGHPTSCCSAADIVATLFFHVLHHDVKDPKNVANDRFILSKGHAAPLLYAAWAEAGFLNPEDLRQLRQFDSDLEGHPTPRLPFVQVPTGSLGQGLSAGVGMAINAKYLDHLSARTYVLLGDGECAEGSVWEAAEIASHYQLDNLCAIVDVNRLGQSGPTIHEYHMEAYHDRWAACGWHPMIVDGHDLHELVNAFQEAATIENQPSVILAKTRKGAGISFLEDQPERHGKALNDDETEKALQELRSQLETNVPEMSVETHSPSSAPPPPTNHALPFPEYEQTDTVATREAFGTALQELGKHNSSVVALDGDVKNSTHVKKFAESHPKRFFEQFIAEQNMVGVAMGLASSGKVPFASTFACFLTRAYDFIRMAAIGHSNIKLMGSHAGISIGEDGPSQMGLEDIAMMAAQPNMTVLYPSDAVCTHWAVGAAAEHDGPVYIRTTRPQTPILYQNQESFRIGGSKVLRENEADVVTLVTAGITLFEALAAYDDLRQQGIFVRVIDLYSIKPIDQEALLEHGRITEGRILTIEDHYEHGGLGDAVLKAVSKERIRVHGLAVRAIPRSGKSEVLLDRFGINARAIIKKVHDMIGATSETI